MFAVCRFTPVRGQPTPPPVAVVSHLEDSTTSASLLLAIKVIIILFLSTAVTPPVRIYNFMVILYPAPNQLDLTTRRCNQLQLVDLIPLPCYGWLVVIFLIIPGCDALGMEKNEAWRAYHGMCSLSTPIDLV